MAKARWGQAFLRADGGDDLGLGVELDVVAGLVPARHGAPQARDALGDRVAMGMRAVLVVQFRAHVVGFGAADAGLDQLVDDVLGRRLVRVAHAEIDDVLATGPGRFPALGDDVEDVGRQALDAREIRTGRRRHRKRRRDRSPARKCGREVPGGDGWWLAGGSVESAIVTGDVLAPPLRLLANLPCNTPTLLLLACPRAVRPTTPRRPCRACRRHNRRTRGWPRCRCRY